MMGLRHSGAYRGTVGAALGAAAVRLRAAGSFSPRLDAELLLGKALGRTRVEVLTHNEWLLDDGVLEAFERLVERRACAEPMAYLLGEREFYGHMFQTDSRALIPRPETELLLDLGRAAVERWRGRGVEPRVVEVGTGTGAVAISLALATGVPVVATELSWAALTLARENAARLGGEVRLVQADLLTGLRGPIHVLLANLPYVPNARDLPPDVRDFEPHVALFGGERGTELIERLLEQAHGLVVGEVCVELDEEEQAEPVAALARSLYDGADVRICRDAGGYDRVVRVSL
jgi:release factor glutamine methyltransferase